MSNINLSLDEIIAKTKVSNTVRGNKEYFNNGKISDGKRGGIKRRANEGSVKAGANTKTVPSGKWLHDKFPSTFSIRTLGSSPIESLDNSHKKIRMNISNLAPTVTTTDLKELFSPYSIDSAFVHYDQSGNHLGTGEIVMKKKEAQRALTDLKGIAIDGRPLRMAIVDGGVTGGSIFSRVQMVKKVVGGSIQKRSHHAHPLKIRPGKKLNGSRRNPLKGLNEKKAAKGNRGKNGKGAKNPKNEKELDAELDAYMKRENMEQ